MKRRSQAIKRMGYLKDQEGIMNRYIQESSSWKMHLEKTRMFISGSFCKSEIESVAVLGSGWLLDVPLEDLLQRFKKIYLVDIHHPVQIRKKTETLKQVELLEEDLTGGAIEQIYRFLRERRTFPVEEKLLDCLSLKAPLESLEVDALVSVNLLNQLDILLCDYMRKRGPFQQEALAPLRAAIQDFHLGWISKLPGCLVTDILEEVADKNGTISSKALLYTQLPEGIRTDRWWWDFDTRGTYHPESRTRMEVQAVEWP